MKRSDSLCHMVKIDTKIDYIEIMLSHLHNYIRNCILSVYNGENHE